MAKTSWAATVNVVDSQGRASCEQTDVQTAVDQAHDNDTVVIGSGTCTWGDQVTWEDKNISVTGQGIGKTIITGPTRKIWVNDIHKASFAISNMTLTGPSQPVGQTIAIYNNSTTPSYGWRIHHIDFNSPGQSIVAVWAAGLTYGLVDHCTVEADGGNIFLMYSYVGFDTVYNGDAAWSLPLDLGGGNSAVYVEDCTIKIDNYYDYESSAVNDMEYGASMVFRHNIVTGTMFQTHAARSSARGAKRYEIYNNVFDGTCPGCANGHFIWPLFIRAGTGVIFNNRISGYYATNNFIVDNQRTCDATVKTWSPTFGCDGTHSWDGNIEASGWPCLDQIGRGPGTPGSQLSVPLYAWNNGTNATCATGGPCDNASGIVLNTGCDSSAVIKAIPHANGEVDYVNNGTNAKSGYTPYTYPHPLITDCTNNPITCDRNSGDTTPPAPPRGLVVN